MKILVANWKSNPNDLGDAKKLFSAENETAKKYSNVTTVITPPLVFIEEMSTMADGAVLGAQDISPDESGPHTGGVSAQMLKGFDVKYVLVGHSEMRANGETNEMINEKIKRLIEADITPILLIGEDEKNEMIRQDILVDQLSRALEGLSKDQVAKVVPVYEPVWAISTNKDAQASTPQDAVKAIEYMESILTKLHGFTADDMPQILYGGSVNPDNVESFFKHEKIAGAVVGGASLKPEKFEVLQQVANENA